MKLFRRLSRGWLIAFSLLAFILVGFKGCMYNHHLSLVPQGLGIWRVVYSKEESWGFGPGGNESGVIVYALSDSVSDTIKERGISYLNGLQQVRAIRAGSTSYNLEWKETPLLFHNRDPNVDRANDVAVPNIYNFLDRYGFGVSLDPEISKTINDAISKPGAFYTSDQHGIVIVIPEKRSVVFAYSG